MYRPIDDSYELLHEDYNALVEECNSLEAALNETTGYLETVFDSIPRSMANSILEANPDIRGVLE